MSNTEPMTPARDRDEIEAAWRDWMTKTPPRNPFAVTFDDFEAGYIAATKRAAKVALRNAFGGGPVCEALVEAAAAIERGVLPAQAEGGERDGE